MRIEIYRPLAQLDTMDEKLPKSTWCSLSTYYWSDIILMHIHAQLGLDLLPNGSYHCMTWAEKYLILIMNLHIDRLDQIKALFD